MEIEDIEFLLFSYFEVCLIGLFCKIFVSWISLLRRLIESQAWSSDKMTAIFRQKGPRTP